MDVLLEHTIFWTCFFLLNKKHWLNFHLSGLSAKMTTISFCVHNYFDFTISSQCSAWAQHFNVLVIKSPSIHYYNNLISCKHQKPIILFFNDCAIGIPSSSVYTWTVKKKRGILCKNSSRPFKMADQNLVAQKMTKTGTLFMLNKNGSVFEIVNHQTSIPCFNNHCKFATT